MPVRKSIHEKDGVFFITITCARWIRLYEMVNGYDIVYHWFDHLKSRGHYIMGYVIMPNHLHVLIGFKNTGKSINSIIGNGKRFMAYELVKRLIAQGNNEVLDELGSLVNQTDRLRGKIHEVFEPSFDWKECYDHRFTEQKLNYMHDNPCQGHWQLVEDRSKYIHSSASFYENNVGGIYPVTSYSEMDDVDLSGDLGDDV